MMQERALPAPDSLRAVLEDVFAAPEYEWDESQNPFAFVVTLFRRVLWWLDGLHEAHPAIYWMLVGLLTGLLIAILAHLTVVVWRALRPRAEEAAVMTPPRDRHDVSWHLEEWRRLRALGKYPEALAHRFTALILELDRRRALVFHPAKTPQEYTSEAGLDDAARTAFAQLVANLYRHLFGGAPVTAADLDSFDSMADRLGAGRAA